MIDPRSLAEALVETACGAVNAVLLSASDRLALAAFRAELDRLPEVAE